MKKLILIVNVFIAVIAVSCTKPQTKFMYKYEYTTKQSVDYSNQQGYNVKITSLGDYKKILTAEEKTKELLIWRKKINKKVLTDTLYFIGTYENLTNNINQ